MYKRNIHRAIATTLFLGVLVGSAHTQKVSYSKGGGKTTASSGDWSVSYSKTPRYARNFDYYYYGQQYAAPALMAPEPTPYVTVGDKVEAAPAPVIGYVAPYSEDEYNALVIEQINADRGKRGEPQIGQKETPRPTPEATPRPTGENATADAAVQPTPVPTDKYSEHPALQVATVCDIKDRGVMVTSTGLEIRLRGVAFASMNSKNPIRREFGGRALTALTELTYGKKIYYVVEKPEIGLDGRTLAIVHLGDGTELNRLALESGMAVMSPDEFTNEAFADRLIEAEHTARIAKRGYWAH